VKLRRNFSIRKQGETLNPERRERSSQSSSSELFPQESSDGFAAE
jgi:hypothetical protein